MKIVHFLDLDWEEDQRRPHIEALSEHCPILCIEPPLTFMDLLLKSIPLLSGNIKKIFSLRKIKDNLFVYKPVMPLPPVSSLYFPKTRWINSLNLFFLKKSLLPILGKCEFNDFVLVIRHPAWHFVAGKIGEKKLCYEISDEWADLPSAPNILKGIIRDKDKKLVNMADIILCSSQNLTISKKRLNPRTFFIPNAADTRLFESSLTSETEVPEDMARISNPRIGLIGNINDHVDIELISYLARTRPDWSIVLVGKINGSRAFLKSRTYHEMRRLKNVHFLGWKNYELLPHYLKGLDVCLLPYIMHEYTKYVYPNKIYQYLAGGKPVVSTALPEMDHLQEVVSIAKSNSEFRALVDNILISDQSVYISHRIEMARRNSVVQNAETRFRLLEEYFYL